MRNVKMFLASGNSLKKDRDEISLFLANKNQYLVKHGIFLELVRWEFLSSSFSETRKQDDFNQQLKDSDIFTCLIYERIGQYTREEFEKAYALYKSGKNPKKFYLYFKTLPKAKKAEATEVNEFREHIEEEQQIYLEYKNPDQLKLFLNQNLDQDLPEMLKEAIMETVLDETKQSITETIPGELLDTLDEADKMLSKNLTEDALEAYQDVLKQVNKRENPVIFGRILLNIAICLMNQSYHQDQEKNLMKALIKLEEAESLLDPITNQLDYLHCQIDKTNIYFDLSSIRKRFYYINKIIEIGERVIQMGIKELDSKLYFQITNRLANCYCDLMSHKNDKTYFEKIQYYFQEALSAIDPQKNPASYCAVLSAEGNAFVCYNLLETDKMKRIASLEQGRKLFEESLQLLTPDEDLFNYFYTLINLSTDLYYLGRLTDEITYYEKAITTTKKALSIGEELKNTTEYLLPMSNLSRFLQTMYTKTKKIEFLEESNEVCLNALSRITLQSHPDRYARFHQTLGNNLLAKANYYFTEVGDKRVSLKQALNEFEIASSILTKEQNLVDFKSVSLSFIRCYLKLCELEQKEENLRNAKDRLDELLSLYSPSTNQDMFYEEAKKLSQDILCHTNPV